MRTVDDIAAAAHPIYATRIRADQYDLGLEYVGYAPDYDAVVFRGDVRKREFTVFWPDAGRRSWRG
jgi:hypothetical protein